ncbi:unnamed protein product [Brassica rapa]|uniref:ATP-dependent Clp protease proteolytic subunit n=1 Tax=Brassica campestris TaxID=3711 RepID=A0A3P5YI68_BRACM|nr:unnamed protein product [Brassica rapa]VDC61063.1 unnamed protein product [Brassica rapa]
MTVATSLDSLLEKLKVKELYLRPSNWDYLHSQSRQFLPPTRASPPSSSSVFVSSPFTLFMFPSVPSSGLMPASDVLIRAKETVANVMRRPYYMDAPKAKEFGVIDRVSLCAVKLHVGIY